MLFKSYIFGKKVPFAGIFISARPFVMAVAVSLALSGCMVDEYITAEKREERPDGYRVLEYTPAPGQFIGEGEMADIKTAEQACLFAERRLIKGSYVSLGAFGGRIVVGFDRSVAAGSDGGYDFAVQGNSFTENNEPGAVWVMRDENGNGLADDVWCRLRGSEDEEPDCIAGYSVTYCRSEGDVPWSDNLGGSGAVERNTFHRQASYYPAWVGESYTLTGLRLPDNSGYEYSDKHGAEVWFARPCGWGYADNCGSDREGTWNRFRIADAVDAAGEAAGLESVDFVMVQCAVQAACPADDENAASTVGEISTEVCGFKALR